MYIITNLAGSTDTSFTDRKLDFSGDRAGRGFQRGTDFGRDFLLGEFLEKIQLQAAAILSRQLGDPFDYLLGNFAVDHARGAGSINLPP